MRRRGGRGQRRSGLKEVVDQEENDGGYNFVAIISRCVGLWVCLGQG